MKLRKILACVLAAVAMPVIPGVYAAELFSAAYNAEDLKIDKENGVVLEQAVPDGDYTVTVRTGGDTETNANIYINGGERVRAYTLEAGQTQDNEQPVVPKDGKITVQVLGENPNVTEIDIEQLPERTEPGEKTTIYIAGDSTAQTYDYTKAYPQTGWGQVFGDYFTDDVVVENRAMAGRSSKSYDNDGRLDKILTEMHPGDYVFIQFGINDGAVAKPERYISVEDYKKLITDRYIGEVKKRGGIPVLLTPTAASWWDEENNCFMESRQEYAEPTRELAEETGVEFIDINEIMTDTWNKNDKDEVLSLYFICEPLESKAYPTGTDDHTHLKAAGAEAIARMVADEVADNIDNLCMYVKQPVSFVDISGHWAEQTINDMQAAGYVTGVDSDKFEPDRNVTRAEFLKMAMEAAGIVGHAYREGECLDAANDDWYCYYLQGALDKDLIPEAMIKTCKKEAVTKTLAEATETAEAITADINAYTGIFEGNTPITREEMAAIAINCASYTAKQGKAALASVTVENSFSDVDSISEAYRNSVEAAQSYGIVEGDDNLFAPQSNLTRAEAVTVAGRLIKTLQ
ncbi:MAG: S-layer homology domain-containing protein [Candidatus Ornithomonoglobus sp.]